MLSLLSTAWLQGEVVVVMAVAAAVQVAVGEGFCLQTIPLLWQSPQDKPIL